MVMSLTPELRTHFGATADRGVLVAQVQPGTPASTAGIAVGDVIVQVGTAPVDSTTDVLAALSDVHKGQSIAVHVVRDGKPRTLQATLTDDPSRLEGTKWPREFMRPFDDDWFEQFRELMQPAKPDRTTKRT
jgi:S1-C subfamily serine protease